MTLALIPTFILICILLFSCIGAVIAGTMWSVEEKRAEEYRKKYMYQSLKNERLKNEIEQIKCKKSFEELLKNENKYWWFDLRWNRNYRIS